MINDQDFKDFNYNVLGVHTKVTGDLVLHGDTIINSHVEGNVEVKDNGKLILERESSVKGQIKSQDLEIFGSVEGDINCTGLVSIRSSAKVEGKITSGRLVIYPGAVVEMKVSSEEQV